MRILARPDEGEGGRGREREGEGEGGREREGGRPSLLIIPLHIHFATRLLLHYITDKVREASDSALHKLRDGSKR